MKNKKKQLKATLAIVLLTATIIIECNQWAFAQTNTGGVAGDRYGQTNNPGGVAQDIRRFGIGDFPYPANAPRAAFEINSNLLTDVDPAAPNTFLPGNVFLTDCQGANNTFWRMLRGGTERFQINSRTNNTVNMGTVQSEPLAFFTNGAANERMRITAAGLVGIGFTNPALINNRLDVDNGDIDVNTATNGYMIGDQYVLRHKGNTTDIFVGVGADALSDNLTNAAAFGANAKVSASNSLVLGGTGKYAVKVGIGVTAPTETLEVNGTAKIASLACKNCLVVTDENGKLHAAENKISELQARITQLENKLETVLAQAK